VRGERQKPTANHPDTQAKVGAPEIDEGPQIAEMRARIEKEPDNLANLKMFAGMLGDKLRATPGVSSPLVFEAIDVLSRILQREPNEPGALVMMADISFDQKAFNVALDFYQRYLKIEGGDLGARARYASTLTFVGRYDDSILELNSVLKSDPKNFPAKAYLAITHAQKGDTERAKQVASEALALAPSEEARARFSAFAASLDSTTPKRGNIAEGGDKAATSLAKGEASVGGVGLERFVALVKANPVAGSKLAGYQLKDNSGVMELSFRAFPMAAMPEFAKQKFFNGLKSGLEQSGLSDVTEIRFLDADSGSEMERLKVK
jgi:tetratricopeptide (TPR) repeat protein